MTGTPEVLGIHRTSNCHGPSTPKYLIIVPRYASLGTRAPRLYKKTNKTQENNTKTPPWQAAGGGGRAGSCFCIMFFGFISFFCIIGVPGHLIPPTAGKHVFSYCSPLKFNTFGSKLEHFNNNCYGVCICMAIQRNGGANLGQRIPLPSMLN